MEQKKDQLARKSPENKQNGYYEPRGGDKKPANRREDTSPPGISNISSKKSLNSSIKS